MPMQIELIPEPFIQLALEASNHPKLVEALNKDTQDMSFVGRLSIIAAYCDVLLDGLYTHAELEPIAEKLIDKLKAKNASIILIN